MPRVKRFRAGCPEGYDCSRLQMVYWWSSITRWISLRQQDIMAKGTSIQEVSATQYKYIDAV